jgi:hypothetical protein
MLQTELEVFLDSVWLDIHTMTKIQRKKLRNLLESFYDEWKHNSVKFFFDEE